MKSVDVARVLACRNFTGLVFFPKSLHLSREGLGTRALLPAFWPYLPNSNAGKLGGTYE